MIASFTIRCNECGNEVKIETVEDIKEIGRNHSKDIFLEIDYEYYDFNAQCYKCGHTI